MKISLNWLRDYVDVALSPEELAARLTMTGTKVEAVDYIGAELRDVLIGRIAHLEPHPDPEVSLQLATVALGGRGTQTVVTGATNIAVGDKVPFAGLGVTLPNGLTLKPRKLRGIVSEGMVLADDELGLGEDHSGIRILDPHAPEGRPLSELLGDAIFDLEITSNRPDCLSVIGVAREVAAITGAELRLPGVQVVEGEESAEDLVRVRVETPLCRRFTARALTGITIGPSPELMVARLRASGVRSINNVVDVTNYVMLEYGHPMHGYDGDRVHGRTLGVRLAREGETVRTLDGQNRRLTPDTLVIVDGDDAPIGLAGVMGGQDTEVGPATTTLLLEVANFDPTSVRRTSTRLGLRSEASNRFEKGLPLYLAHVAADRAVALMAELTGGVVARGTVDVGDKGERRRTIVLPTADPQRLLGMPVTVEGIVESLEPLGFEVRLPIADEAEPATAVAWQRTDTAVLEAPATAVAGQTIGRPRSDVDGPQSTLADPAPPLAEQLDVVVPPWREDVTEEADLVEEVARMVGYDKVPETLLRGSVPAPGPDSPNAPVPAYGLMRRLRPFLLACGLSEAMTYALTGDASLQRLRAPDAPEAGTLSEDEIAALIPNAAAVTEAGATYGPIRLQNPLSPERAVLRPTLMAGLLDALSLNLRNGRDSVRLFELSRAYYPRVFEAPDPTRLPALERRTLSVVLGGLREERLWDTPVVPLDFYDLKGVAEDIMAYCGVSSYTIEPEGHPVLHPGRAARLRLTDRRGRPSTELAVLGEVHPVVAARFDLPGRALLLELDIDALAAVVTAERPYRDVSRYPAVRRDLAVVVALETPAADVLRTVRQGGGKLLQSAQVFDVYTGEQAGEGRKSLALSLVFQSLDKTLGEDDIDGPYANIQRRLQEIVGATFRG